MDRETLDSFAKETPVRRIPSPAEAVERLTKEGEVPRAETGKLRGSRDLPPKTPNHSRPPRQKNRHEEISALVVLPDCLAPRHRLVSAGD